MTGLPTIDPPTHPVSNPPAPTTPVPQQWRPHQLRARRPLLWAILCIAGIGGLQPLDPSLHSIAFTGAVSDLGMNPGIASFVKSIGTIVLAASMLGVGILGDRHGRRRMLVSGVTLMGVSGMITALAPDVAVFTVGRILMGVGTAMMFSMCVAIIPTLYSKAELPKAFGIFFALGSAELMVCTAFSGIILGAFGWRTMYALVGVLALVGAVAATLLLPENRAATSRRFDVIGVLLAAVGLIALVWSIGQASIRGWSGSTVLFGLSIAVVTLGVFAWWEARVREPGFPIRLFAIPAFSAACIAGVLFNWADASLLGQYPAMALPAGVAPAVVTAIVALMYLGMVSGSAAAATLQRRFGLSTRTMFVSGLLLCATSLIAQLGVSAPTDIVLPAIGLFCVGFAVMWMQNPQAAVILGCAPSDQVGAVSAVKPAVGQLGFGLGFATAAPIASLFTTGPTLDVGGFGHGLAVEGLVFIAAAAAVAYLLRSRRTASVATTDASASTTDAEVNR
ncbi:MFS transporter [Gordonia rhizosphera]|uniref:Putative drug resistance transporter n=1 Tax=Gordonia rhizosphera NBRC 16068 TaxID=1108045 RepID=K6WH23_9ACTN|nr:MFS transporter [Gordonia rhizosphera]GAB93086.1 putative drug resistance transporter [Gordonia rhizosphera NBRC 16068]